MFQRIKIIMCLGNKAEVGFDGQEAFLVIKRAGQIFSGRADDGAAAPMHQYFKGLGYAYKYRRKAKRAGLFIGQRRLD